MDTSVLPAVRRGGRAMKAEKTRTVRLPASLVRKIRMIAVSREQDASDWLAGAISELVDAAYAGMER